VVNRADTPTDADQPNEDCPVCDRSPAVLVGIRHPVMRRWTIELLETEHGCWTVAQPRAGELLVDATERNHPELVVVDSADFPACCQAALDALPAGRVIVIGPEPDRAFRDQAIARGAGGWVCRDHIGEELSAAMRAALGCRHEPCPPAVPGTTVDCCVEREGISA
jgi:DNA-binding NarL/FixJ family response regulator